MIKLFCSLSRLWDWIRYNPMRVRDNHVWLSTKRKVRSSFITSPVWFSLQMNFDLWTNDTRPRQVNCSYLYTVYRTDWTRWHSVGWTCAGWRNSAGLLRNVGVRCAGDGKARRACGFASLQYEPWWNWALTLEWVNSLTTHWPPGR